MGQRNGFGSQVDRVPTRVPPLLGGLHVPSPLSLSLHL